MKRSIKAWLAVFALALSGAAVAVSCDTVDEAFDCNSVCTRYRDCFDHTYNVDQCRSSCRSRAANDPNVKGAADACSACIDDMSCASATFNCTSSCAQIVP